MKKIIVMLLLLGGQLMIGMQISESFQKDMRFRLAAERGDLEQVKRSLEQGVNVNNANTTGNTALTDASEHGHVEMVRLLLDRGANINVKTYSPGQGLTALGFAVLGRYFDVILELLTFIPLAERKAIQENIRSLLPALKYTSIQPKPPRDIQKLIGQTTINRLAQELMPRVLERARILAANAEDGQTAQGIALLMRDNALARTDSDRAAQYQAIADLLNFDNPASQAILRRQVEANIRRIVANPLPAIPEPVMQQQQAQQPWYQRAWNSAKQTAQNYWKWIAGGTAVTVGGYMAWKKMQKN
jgi:hypothetical protein